MCKKLNNDSLLAKLAMSDMYALDFQYHRKCLVALCNCMHQHSSDNDCKSNHSQSTSIQAEALAGLALYIEELAQNEDDFHSWFCTTSQMTMSI